MFISTGQFVHDVLPGMMRGRDRFGALLVTYNDADIPVSYPDGLTIRLVAGNPLEGADALLRLISSIDEGDRYLAERYAGQRAVERAVFRRGAFDLAVVYLGLTQFDRALIHALRLKSSGVAAHTAVLTCDCDENEKASKISRASARTDFIASLLTSKCGGCSDLEQLAVGMAEVWPQVRRA